MSELVLTNTWMILFHSLPNMFCFWRRCVMNLYFCISHYANESATVSLHFLLEIYKRYCYLLKSKWENNRYMINNNESFNFKRSILMVPNINFFIRALFHFSLPLSPASLVPTQWRLKTYVHKWRLYLLLSRVLTKSSDEIKYKIESIWPNNFNDSDR